MFFCTKLVSKMITNIDHRLIEARVEDWERIKTSVSADLQASSSGRVVEAVNFDQLLVPNWPRQMFCRAFQYPTSRRQSYLVDSNWLQDKRTVHITS